MNSRRAHPLRVARHRATRPPELHDDVVAIEEPLELRVNGSPFAVVMRTPGHDHELAAGYLLTEGLIAAREQIAELAPCRAPSGEVSENALGIKLTGASPRALRELRRRTTLGSSCGTCGKASIADVHRNFPPLTAPVATIRAALLPTLPDKLAAEQETFKSTGGLHGVALFRVDGTLLHAREDVGRHNAVDKVIGRALLDGLLPLEGHVLFVSGRISFEIVQKALAARIPVIAGISAPTSLAVEFARANGQTLAGFVRDGGANVYAGALAR